MAESDLIRGNVDTIILKVLYEGDRYGYDLIKQINSRGDGQWEIKQPTVYACLKRLEKQGFISSYWDSSESDGGRRKYYTLTESGKEVFLKYKNEFERASALFGGLISGGDSMFMPDDYSDVEDETYTVSKRPRSRKKQPKPQPEPENTTAPSPAPDETSVDQAQEPSADELQAPIHEEQPSTAEPETAQAVDGDGAVILEDDNPNNPEGVVILEDDETDDTVEKPTEQTENSDEYYDEQYFNDLIALAESLSESEEELEAQQQSQTAAETPAYDVPPAREPLDPRAIIEDCYRSERGESYSDVHAKTVYEPTRQQAQQPAAPIVNTAPPAPVVKQPSPAPAQPVSREITPIPPQQPAPAVSTIGFPDPDESQARKEYKTVLTDLVERLEIAAPAIREERTEQAATEQAAATTAETEEDKQFVKIKNTARDLGNDVQVTAHNNSAKQYAHKYYYYSNRLLMTHYTIMCVAMFIIGLTLFLTFYVGLKLRMPYDYLLYMAAGLLPIVMFIITVIRYAGNPDKRKRINLSMGVSIFVRCIIMIQVAVVIYCVNLIWGMPVGFSYGYLPSLIIPLAYSVFIPISKVIFSTLLKSGSYAVE